ncbi:MAG: DUF3568 family protein [Desulfomicrobium sp.]|jgi:hypothetical protein|nr:DUF3568 family protein [Desulfomicrobium sp.]NLV97821.1 DUF3568 family protein [Desulfovibrionales bacterium]
MKKAVWILLVLFLSGCAAAVVGGVAAVGTYTYVAGQLKYTHNGNLDNTYQAALKACSSLQLMIMNQDKKLSKASLRVKEGDRDIWITFTVVSSTTTEVSIRVGYFGDEVASRKIHEEIRANLR